MTHIGFYFRLATVFHIRCILIFYDNKKKGRSDIATKREMKNKINTHTYNFIYLGDNDVDKR